MLLAGGALAASHLWPDDDDTRGAWLEGTIRSSGFERRRGTGHRAPV